MRFQDFFASYSMGTQRRFSGTFSIQRGGFFSGDITAYGYRRGRIEITPQFLVRAEHLGQPDRLA